MNGEPAVGSFVRYKGATWRVADRDEFGLWLRPLGGGKEVTAAPDRAEPISACEGMWPVVRDINVESSRGRP